VGPAVPALYALEHHTPWPEPEIRHVVRTLFSDEQGREAAARIDRRIDPSPASGECS